MKKLPSKAILIIAVAAVAVAVVAALLMSKPENSVQSAETDKAAAEETAVQEQTISLGGEEYSSTADSLCPTGIDFSELYTSIESFTSLESLDLRQLSLSNEEIKQIVEAVPNTEVSYNVTVLGNEFPQNTETLDLSDATAEDSGDLVAALELLPQLASVTLPQQNSENNLPLTVISKLRDAAPQAVFDYSYTLYGQTFRLNEEELMYDEAEIGNEGVAVFYELLPCMKELQRLVLDDCGVDNESMAQLRESFPDIKIVWRIHWDHFSTLTDAVVIRATGTETDAGIVGLKYCTEARFIDFGHSKNLTDIEFTRYMPNLQILIIVDSGVKDLEPLTACKNLLLIEVVNCYQLTSLEPLAQCEKLRYVNFSNAMRISDISPLFNLPDLERVYAADNKIPESQIEELKKLHPDCWVTFERPGNSRVSYNYSIGWRLDEAPKVMAEWYKEMRRIFGIGYNIYDSQGYFSYKNVAQYECPVDELVYFALD